MKPDPERIRELFVAALGRIDPRGWDAYLQAECVGDPDLAREVSLLLDAHLEAGSLLQHPAFGLGATGDRGPAREEATDATEPPPAEAPGTVIGPSRLIEPAGEGGMGTVWMAQQSEPVKRLVAIKLIKAGMDSRQVIARFEAERQALALMDHPHIARVLDAGATPEGR